jgi:hypothetical protein
VENVRTLKKQDGDRHLVLRHHGQPKKWRHGDGGSWKKLAACRGMAHHAIPAWHKGHSHIRPMVKQRQQKNWTRAKVARGAPIGWTLERGQQVHQECNKGI